MTLRNPIGGKHGVGLEHLRDTTSLHAISRAVVIATYDTAEGDDGGGVYAWSDSDGTHHDPAFIIPGGARGDVGPGWQRIGDAAGGTTKEGGRYVWLTNKTGSASVKGHVVSASTAHDNAFMLQAGQYDAIGVVYDSSVPDGQLCRVVVVGIAAVMFEDGNAPVHGYWVRCSTVDGRAYAEAVPSGGGFVNAEEHFKEIGHCLASVSAGTNVLANCLIHFN